MFVFECLLALVLIACKRWFFDPFSPYQIISWVFLSASLALAAAGFSILVSHGKPGKNIEDTTILVTQGPYRYIRHPLYASLLFFAWGVFFKVPTYFPTFLAMAATGFLVMTAKTEEGENLAKFGPEYAAYMKKTKMLIPFVL